jgi:glycosyltransferase involved in cell wall biosynthesis
MISILCSVYNASEHLDKYLKYVDDQTLESFEILFVDANSSDDSLKKIMEYKFREGITKIVFGAKERVGIYEAWNQAIEHSSHDYVMNYNTDDKLFKSSLATLATYAKLHPEVDVIYSDSFISSDTDHTPSSWFAWADANKKENLLQGCCVGPYPLLKKSTIVDAGMFNDKFVISGDYEMWCRLNSLGKKFLKIDEPLGVYYHNPHGVSTASTTERHSAHIREDNTIRMMYG